MPLDALGHLLEELSPLVNSPLKVNQQNTCMFKFDDTYVQIEVERKGESVLLVAQLGTIPPGKYRESLFYEALKQNGVAEATSGIFAYSKQADTLILFHVLPLKIANGEKVFSLLPEFCSKAKAWIEAIAHGETPTSGPATARGGPHGLFSAKH